MTIALTTTAYIVAAIFYIRILWRFVLWSRLRAEDVSGYGGSPVAALKTVLDIFLLRRLFSVNPVIWLGEWVFHVSFILVFVSHIRYVLISPSWVVAFVVPFGKIASYTLPASVLFILFVRLVNFVFVKGYFTSRYNLFLTFTLLLTSGSGYFLRHVYRTDVVGVKEYFLSLLAFRPVQFPDSTMFLLHFALALLFISLVPTHIFTAPIVTLAAARRDEALVTWMHDNE